MTDPRTGALLDLIRLLSTAMANAALYAPDHPQVARLCDQALARLPEALAGGEDLSLLLIDDELVVDGRPLVTGIYTARLTRALKLRGIGHLRILVGVTREELLGLAAALSGSGGQVRATDHLRFGRVELRQEGEEREEGDDREVRRMLALSDLPDAELARLMELYEGTRKERRLRIGGIAEVVAGFISAFRESGDSLLALAPLRSMNEYTFTHSTNVCILNLAQAVALGIDGPALHDIGIAAMLHDVGKLFVPEEILTKPGKLDEEEWRLVRQHPLRGAQYLLETPGAPHLAVVVAFEHHMRYDGRGYPQVPAGWRQNVCSYMTAISDCFDALRTRRAYRGSLDLEEISAMMLADAGTLLHPFLTRNFLGVLEKLSRTR